MFKDALIPYVALKGGLTQQSFYALTGVNEFALSHVELRNENKALEAVIGLKGTISKRIGFNVMASFANVKDRALFVKDTLHSAGNRFNVIYDTMNITTFEAALNYQLHEKIKLDLVGRYYSYNALNNTYAWNLPQVQVVLRGSYNLYDKFIFSADVNLEGGRKALVYATESGATLENGQYAVPLGFIADANLSVEYRYNKRISAFLNFNNIAAQRYKRWYNYPTQGLQAMAGVTFRF
jgi:outer membrane receptor protein involved in Fe transport